MSTLITPCAANQAAAVTPSDSSDLNDGNVGLYVGSAGDVRVTTTHGSDVVFQSVPAGAVLPVCVRRLWATGTTASRIIELWYEPTSGPAYFGQEYFGRRYFGQRYFG